MEGPMPQESPSDSQGKTSSKGVTALI
jgi:hypothetical protein